MQFRHLLTEFRKDTIMKKTSSEKEAKKEHSISRRKVLGTLGILAGSSLLPAATEAGISENNENSEELQVRSFESLAKAQRSNNIKPGDVIETAGYHAPGDGGAARYLASHTTESVEINGGDIIELKNQLIATLTGISKVNYNMFGARGNGSNDDGIAIRLAHQFANRNRLPVENLTGKFYIENTRNIEIQTSINWGQSMFYINEAFNKRQPVFVVLSYESPIELIQNEKLRNALVEKLKPGVQQIEELSEYSNWLFWVQDSEDRIGYRYGRSYSGQSRGREELFYVEENGRITGDIAWTFNDLTNVIAYWAETSYLIIEGGSFYLSGTIPGRKKMGYFHNGIQIRRSRTIIRNQWMGLQPGKKDTSLHPRSGFYNFSNVFDTSLENIRLIPWEKNRPGNENDVHSGTYGISGNRMLNTSFKNITAEGTRIHWGVFGTNMNKNFRVENCRLNRIDVHFHCWNLTIKDSQIGNNGITITGGGALLIENTSSDSTRFVNFRRDFGAKWDGNIVIKNCILRPAYSSENSILFFLAADFDYGYPIGMAKSIFVDNFIFDYITVPQNNNESWLIRTSDFSITSEGKRSFFPEYIHFRNVFTQGRSKGVRIIKISDPAGYRLPKQGFYDGTFFEANAEISLDTVQLENIGENDSEGYHLQFLPVSSAFEPDAYSLYPRLYIKNCGTLSAHLDDAAAKLIIENTAVTRMHTKEGLPVKGELTFTGCKFIPAQMKQNVKSYQVASELGTSFINCTFHLPRQEKKEFTEVLPDYGFMEINRQVLFNHLNSRLGRDVLMALAERNIKLKPEFKMMLKNHHELD